MELTILNCFNKQSPTRQLTVKDIQENISKVIPMYPSLLMLKE